MTVTDEKCGRCDRYLAATNKHPDRLCGMCQQELRSFLSRQASPQREAWIAAGRPRIIRGAKVRAALKVAREDLATWPASLLEDAARELIRRRRAAVDALAGVLSSPDL